MSFQEKTKLALQLQTRGKLQEAIQLYQEILQEEPKHETALVNVGIILFQAKQVKQAMQLLQTAVSNFPQSANAHFNLGFALLKLKKEREALPFLEKTVLLDSNFHQARLYLGNVYNTLNYYDKAYEQYKHAYPFQKNSLELLNNWAKVSISLKNYLQAEKILKKALTLYPDNALLLANQGTVHKHKHEFLLAEKCFKKSISLNPTDWRLLNELAILYHTWNKFDKALAYFRRSLASEPTNEKVHSNILYFQHYLPQITNEGHYQTHQEWQKRHAPVSLVMNKPFKTSPIPPLKVGLVSGDFFRHPVAVFTLPWLENANKERISFHAYTQIQNRDNFTEEVRKHCSTWVETNDLSDQEVAEKIYEDGIHVLIDLAGHTGANRLKVFAFKPAPLQVSLYHYPNTTGLPQIDYKIVDKVATPPHLQKYYFERLAYIEEYVSCYKPPTITFKIKNTPALKNGYITLGCFNNPIKYNKEVFALWGKILKQIPNSRLLLVARHFTQPQGLEPILKTIAEQGIDTERVNFDSAPHIETYFNCYNKIDIALDPFPYNGCTTTNDSLFMGVPVVTLAGDSYVSRMGVSMLQNLGHPEWIGKDTEAYKNIVVNLVQDLENLNQIRQGLREEFLNSPLCNAPLFAERMEKLLYQLYEDKVS